jgi:glutamate-ammonia-ligase adenylyltransferase
VQYLQIEHGRRRPELRTPHTLEALSALSRLGIIPEKSEAELREGYIFLRTLIDGMRIVRGNAKDLVLPETESDEFKYLARRLGYHDADWARAARRLARDIRRHMDRVHRFFVRRFGRPGPAGGG